MIGTLLRVFVGFAAAAFAAGLALVLHADPDIMTRGFGSNDEMLGIADLALKAATHIAIFAAPFALIMAAIAEWQRARSPWFYILAGLAIAAGGFMAQHVSEDIGQSTVLNDYAVRAFGLAGVVAGLVYWAIAGRCAGGAEAAMVEAVPAGERHQEPPKAKKPIADAEVASDKTPDKAADKAVDKMAGKAAAKPAPAAGSKPAETPKNGGKGDANKGDAKKA